MHLLLMPHVFWRQTDDIEYDTPYIEHIANRIDTKIHGNPPSDIPAIVWNPNAEVIFCSHVPPLAINNKIRDSNALIPYRHSSETTPNAMQTETTRLVITNAGP